MPAGFDSYDAFAEWFDGPREVAERLWTDLQAEAQHDHGDAEAFLEGIQNGTGYIADVGVEILSGVDVPAIDSQMLTLKSETGDVWGGERDVLLRKDDDEDRRISYAAAMIPREPDKEGDVVSTPQVERAAHNYMKALQGDTDGTGVDTDHNLIDDKGYVVESHILDEAREYDLPDGTTKSHAPGTWVVGIEWEPETWQRVKSGDIEGLSIYGMAEQLPLERGATAKTFEVPFADETVVHLVYESRTAAEKASEEMGLGGAVHEHTFDGMDVFMPGETHDDFVDAYMDDAERTEVEADADAVAKPTTFDDEVPDDITDMSACIAWAEDVDGIDDAAAYCQAHNTGEKAFGGGQAAADDGQTVKDGSGEPTNQNGPMSDDSTGDGDGGDDGAAKDAPGVDTGAIASEVADAVKDELSDLGGSTEAKVEADEVEDEVAELADSLGVPVADVMEQIDPMLDGEMPEQMANESDGDGEDDDEYEDKGEDAKSAAEKRAESDPNFEKGYSGEGVRENEADGGDDAVSGNPLASREATAKAWEEGQ